MAPEQVAGKPVDYRTDIYSLGLITCRNFYRNSRFSGRQRCRRCALASRCRKHPFPPHEIEPGIPVSIERAILRCLEKDPSKRFPSIGELENALRGTATPPAVPTPAVVTANLSTHAEVLSKSFYSLPEQAPKTALAARLDFAGSASRCRRCCEAGILCRSRSPQTTLLPPIRCLRPSRPIFRSGNLRSAPNRATDCGQDRSRRARRIHARGNLYSQTRGCSRRRSCSAQPCSMKRAPETPSQDLSAQDRSAARRSGICPRHNPRPRQLQETTRPTCG